MAINKITGVTLGESASLPATYDGSGYGALTFTTIGEITDIGELGKVWNMIMHEPLAQEYPTKMKDSYDVPDVTLTLARNASDTGQTGLETALDASAAYAFKITMPSGNTYEFCAFVTKVGMAQAQKGGFEARSVSLSVVPESLYEA